MWASQPMLSNAEQDAAAKAAAAPPDDQEPGALSGDWCDCGECDTSNRRLSSREKLCCRRDPKSDALRLSVDEYDVRESPATCVVDRAAFTCLLTVPYIGV